MPEDWAKWTLDKRRSYWASEVHGDVPLVDRDRVCALEIWCELFGGNPKDLNRVDANEINAAVRAAPGWTDASRAMRCGCYGVQKGYQKEPLP